MKITDGKIIFFAKGLPIPEPSDIDVNRTFDIALDASVSSSIRICGELRRDTPNFSSYFTDSMIIEELFIKNYKDLIFIKIYVTKRKICRYFLLFFLKSIYTTAIQAVDKSVKLCDTLSGVGVLKYTVTASS